MIVEGSDVGTPPCQDKHSDPSREDRKHKETTATLSNPNNSMWTSFERWVIVLSCPIQSGFPSETCLCNPFNCGLDSQKWSLKLFCGSFQNNNYFHWVTILIEIRIIVLLKHHLWARNSSLWLQHESHISSKLLQFVAENIIYTVCWELKFQKSYGPVSTLEYLQQKAWGKKYVTHLDSVVAQCGFNNSKVRYDQALII